MQAGLTVSGLSAQEIFSLAGQIAMLGWMFLIFLPHRIKPLFFVPQYLIPLGLGLVYSGLALSRYFVIEGGYGALEQVKLLFQDDFMLLAGWIHYLAFDLFIGAWIAQQADQLGVSRLLQAPILIATFMFGPIGLVIFLCIKGGVKGVPNKMPVSVITEATIAKSMEGSQYAK